ncbi:unnamed protein product [Didymodactylos carnosus]|uniref:Uncharacterized protein n=1 Tax=Didymodactylos carnosus TaxID=1234261 RepID=A0A814MN88_9BILA|nr:unnamed protein product [Didymodactylos carnosus]CAF3847573.1 unnamed protein product [Didymodactylos carnosus]
MPALLSPQIEQLYEHFKSVNIKLKDKFSLARYVGKQLKLGVRNKEDYFELCQQRAWPLVIQGKQIKVTIPKVIPEHFTLVVRYIPNQINIEQVKDKVKKSAQSADNFRKIVYHYERSTTDYRFTVSDIHEYNGLLTLERIGVFNLIRPVTQYLPSNKLTYCTRCWELGHMKLQCQHQRPKCKVCLEEYSPFQFLSVLINEVDRVWNNLQLGHIRYAPILVSYRKTDVWFKPTPKKPDIVAFKKYA